MRLFRLVPRRADEGLNEVVSVSEPGADESEASSEGPESIPGERGPASVHRARSLQSRVSNLLAAGLMTALGIAVLSWYYAHVFREHKQPALTARQAVQAKAGANAPLPPLGAFQRPIIGRQDAPPAHSLAAQLLGPPPVLPAAGSSADRAGAQAAWRQAEGLQQLGRQEAAVGSAPDRPRTTALRNALAGPVFSAASGDANSPPSPTVSATGFSSRSMALGALGAPPWAEPSGIGPGASPASRSNPLAALLRPTVTRTVQASVLPTQRLLLPKGAFIDCTLETAIDSTLPGMTTCVTATDTFSADGEVVLLERGTQLVGETRGDVRQGQARVFVLWTEARTPTGVVVPLDSPGTDAVGRSGLAGKVNTHFWARFGAAILVSVIDAGVQAGVQSTGNGTVIVNPSTSENVMTGVLRSTVDIPPTITVAPGARIQVLVARNVDFRSVYRLALEPSAQAVPVARVRSRSGVRSAAVFQAGGK